MASIYENSLQQNNRKVQLPQDRSGPTWPPFHRFRTRIWSLWYRGVMWKRSIMTTVRNSSPRPLPELEMFWKPAELGDGPLVTFRLITVDTSICWSLRRPLHRVVRLATSWWRRSQCCSQTWRSMLNCSCSRSLMSCSAGVKFLNKKQLFSWTEKPSTCCKPLFISPGIIHLRKGF